MGELDALLDLAPVGNRYLFQQPESPGDSNSFWSTPDGALGVAEIRNALGLLDVAYIVNYGAATTFVTAKTGLTAAQPDLNLDIPAGTSVILLGFQVAFGAMTGTVNHFWLQFGSSLVGNGTSNAATGGPTSLGTPILSACTARQAYSGSGTAPASPLELFSLEDPTAATGSVPLAFAWNPETLFPIIGPASIQAYGVSTTTALTFKAQLYYAEVPSSYFA